MNKNPAVEIQLTAFRAGSKHPAAPRKAQDVTEDVFGGRQKKKQPVIQCVRQTAAQPGPLRHWHFFKEITRFS